MEGLGKGRFTPTCVGRILAQWCEEMKMPVHPHVRGENLTGLSSPRSWAGSPPRAWGELNAVEGMNGSTRFTPTCVGRMPPMT